MRRNRSLERERAAGGDQLPLTNRNGVGVRPKPDPHGNGVGVRLKPDPHGNGVEVRLKPDPHAPLYRPERSRRRRETVSSVTAASKMAPVTMYLIDEL